MTTYMFPGQGSQFQGMGEELFHEFKELVDKANNILDYSIQEICLKNPENRLNETQYTQPILFVINALMYLKKIETNQSKPNFVIGHSLGEYNALFAADVFDFETGVRLVAKRGQLMSQATEGAMAAVLGLTADKVNDVLHDNKLQDMTIANYNTNTQIIVTGNKGTISTSEKYFKAAGAKLYKPLNVSGAFHSDYMQNASEKFTDFLKPFSFQSPAIPIIANINAKPYPSDSNAIKDILAKQITSSVLWLGTVKYLLNNGENNFIEIGPGKVLTNLVKRIL